MAKVYSSASTDFSGLVADLVELSNDLPSEIYRAADLQMDYLSKAIRTNWDTMNPWQSTNTANFVSDSVGYNIEYGNTNKSVVGMAGVFKVDHVSLKYGRDPRRDISAPQLAYWVEYGFKNNAPIPFGSNAYYATLDKQDEIFADELAKSLGKRLNK